MCLWYFFHTGNFDYFGNQEKLHLLHDVVVKDEYVIASSLTSWYEEYINWTSKNQPGQYFNKSSTPCKYLPFNGGIGGLGNKQVFQFAPCSSHILLAGAIATDCRSFIIRYLSTQRRARLRGLDLTEFFSFIFVLFCFCIYLCFCCCCCCFFFAYSKMPARKD